MKKLALLLIIALFVGTAAAQVKNVAVVETEIDVQSGTAVKLNRTEVRQITAELRREAVKNLPRERYNIMTTETVQAQGGAVLEECAEENCVIALGSKIGADYIVRGTIRRTRTRFRLSVDIYETENGFLVTSSEAVSSENIEELIDKAAAACAEMYKTFANAHSSASRPEPKPPVLYTITAAANPPNGGSVSRNPNQTYYAAGTKANLTAVPANGYAFTGWSGDTTSTKDILTVAMNGDKTLTANFQYIQKTYTLKTNISPLYGGSVTRHPDKETYAAGEEVTVTAAPADGYSFIGWSGAVSGSGRANRVKITMDGDKALTAGFYKKLELESKPKAAAQMSAVDSGKTLKIGTRKTYTLTTNGSPLLGGSVTRYPDKETYIAGEEVTVTAAPADGYSFTGWSGAVSGSGRANRLIITMDGDKTLTAGFYKTTELESKPEHEPAARMSAMDSGKILTDSTQQTYTLTTKVSPLNSGFVYHRSLSDKGFRFRTATTETYTTNDTAVTIGASPAYGYTFAGWSGDVSGTVNPGTITMNKDMDVTANFSKKQDNMNTYNNYNNYNSYHSWTISPKKNALLIDAMPLYWSLNGMIAKWCWVLGFGLQYERSLHDKFSLVGRYDYLGVWDSDGYTKEFDSVKDWSFNMHSFEAHARYYPSEGIFFDWTFGYNVNTINGAYDDYESTHYSSGAYDYFKFGISLGVGGVFVGRYGYKTTGEFSFGWNIQFPSHSSLWLYDPYSSWFGGAGPRLVFAYDIVF